jgi:RNA polymerase sigma-70 factor (ECF subfamily)
MADPSKDAGDQLPRALPGSPEELGRVLEAYRNYLLRIAEQELDPDLRTKAGASDLVQETFLEAQRDFARFCGTSEDELRAWLRQPLLYNLANFARRYRGTAKRDVGREVSLEPAGSQEAGGGPAADTPSPGGQAVARERAEAVRQVLQRLPEDYRRVLLWHYEEQRSFEEIAGLLGRTPNAVRKLFARALERFQQEMGAEP